ncbi:MAG: porin, partial [Holosporaceae bacterium]|nr:porin [Holosporaceae bacterium]
KITWLSPLISGFSAGLSFTLDSRDSNLFKTKHDKLDNFTEKDDFAHSSAYSQNIVTGGIAYEFGAPDCFNAKISVSGWLGKGKSCCSDVEVQNVRAYNLGLILGYADFKASFGYTDNGKSLLAKKYATQDVSYTFDPSENYNINEASVGLKEEADSGKIYSIGMAYIFDKLSISAGYFRSVVKFSGHEKATADIISIAAEYKFDKVFSSYIEYDNIQTNTCDRARAYGSASHQSTIGKNRANAVMIGAKFNF